MNKKCVQCFRVLSDETRLKLLKSLQSGKERSVGSMTKKLGVTQPTVSHHLKLLDERGLVIKERKGRETYYRFNEQYPCKGCGVLKVGIKT